jgi:hypothetical protein
MRGGAAYIAGFFSALNVAITLISCMSLWMAVWSTWYDKSGV